MGACISSAGGISEEEKARHREAERQMRDQKTKLDHQVKVRLSVVDAFDRISNHVRSLFRSSCSALVTRESRPC